MDNGTNDPSGENKESALLWTDEWGTEGKHYCSKSIHCYQNQALNRYETGDIWKKGLSLHKACPRWPSINQDPVLMFITMYGDWKIGNSRSDIAMFTIKKLIGLCMDLVLKTTVPMVIFPIRDTTKIRQWKMDIPIILASWLKQLDVCVPFIVAVRFADILEAEKSVSAAAVL